MQPVTPCHRSAVTTSQAAISARNLSLTLGSDAAPVEILRGIDLDIAKGETVALLGPSGSGKSSLMAVLSGLERASGGTAMYWLKLGQCNCCGQNWLVANDQTIDSLLAAHRSSWRKW